MIVKYCDSLDTLPVVASADFPLSLGSSVHLCTNHPLVFTESEATNKQLAVFADDSYSGFCAFWPEHRKYVIYINAKEGTKYISTIRVIELVAHEVTHLVDSLLGEAGVENVDTEIRAYYTDWLVGKVLHHFCIGENCDPRKRSGHAPTDTRDFDRELN